jgi:hypothetical protein
MQPTPNNDKNSQTNGENKQNAVIPWYEDKPKLVKIGWVF